MMQLIPWGKSLTSDFDRLFNGFFKDEAVQWKPSIDLSETESEVKVQAEVPGMDPKEFEITLKDGVLTLSGEKKDTREVEKDGLYHVERRFGSFQRQIPLPANVNEDEIKAEYRDGVLTIHLPKVPVEGPKRIEVK